MKYVTIFSCALAFILAGANLLSLATVSWWVVFLVFPGIPLALLLVILLFIADAARAIVGELAKAGKL